MDSGYGAWLAGLAPGQPCAILSGGYATRAELAAVQRLTATQIVLAGDGRRFRRDTGGQVGDHRARLLPLDAWEVRSARVHQAYEAALSEIHHIQKRVDWTNPRTPEVYARGLRDLHAAMGTALAAVDALLASGAAGDAPEHLGDAREGN